MYKKEKISKKSFLLFVMYSFFYQLYLYFNIIY